MIRTKQVSYIVMAYIVMAHIVMALHDYGYAEDTDVQ